MVKDDHFVYERIKLLNCSANYGDSNILFDYDYTKDQLSYRPAFYEPIKSNDWNTIDKHIYQIGIIISKLGKSCQEIYISITNNHNSDGKYTKYLIDCIYRNRNLDNLWFRLWIANPSKKYFKYCKKLLKRKKLITTWYGNVSLYDDEAKKRWNDADVKEASTYRLEFFDKLSKQKSFKKMEVYLGSASSVWKRDLKFAKIISKLLIYTSMESLNLTGTHLNNVYGKYFVAGICGTKKLKFLDISDTKLILCKNYMTSLSEWMKSDACNLESLLICEEEEGSEHLNILCDGIKEIESLEELSFEQTKILDVNKESVFKIYGKLKRLDWLSFENMFNDQGDMEKLTNNMINNDSLMKNLKTLILTTCDLDDTHVPYICRIIRRANLTTLKLTWNYFTRAGYYKIINTIKKHGKELQFLSFDWEYDSIEIVHYLIGYNLQNLHSIILCKQRDMDKELAQEEWQRLQKVVINNPYIYSLVPKWAEHTLPLSIKKKLQKNIVSRKYNVGCCLRNIIQLNLDLAKIIYSYLQLSKQNDGLGDFKTFESGFAAGK